MLRNVLQLPKLISSSPVLLANSMSQYNQHFIQPVFKKDQQAAIYESGDAAKMTHLPIKAAANNESSSVFYDQRVAKFTNYIMWDGKKELARELVRKTFENIKRIQLEKYHKSKTEEEKSQIETDPKKILHLAIENCRPVLNVTPIRRGGTKYQVPVPISEKSSYYRACKWLVEASREKEKKVHLPEKMAYELLDAAQNQGRVVKRKQDLHKLCEANRAYAHYRWS